jgi:serine protease Do
MVPVARAVRTPRSRTIRRSLRSALAATALATSVAVSGLATPAFAKGPESLADLADQVTDAVVNISASTTVEARPNTRSGPQLPPGTPFEDLLRGVL